MIRFSTPTILFTLSAMLGTATPGAAEPVTITSGFVAIGGTRELSRGFRRSIGYDIFTDSFRLHGAEGDGVTQELLFPRLPRVGFWTPAGASSETFIFLDAFTLTVNASPAFTPTPFSLSGRLIVIHGESGETLFDDVVSGAGTATWDYSQTPEGFPIVWRVTYDFSESAPVPEPATLVLVGLGIAGLAARRRRRE